MMNLSEAKLQFSLHQFPLIGQIKFDITFTFATPAIDDQTRLYYFTSTMRIDKSKSDSSDQKNAFGIVIKKIQEDSPVDLSAAHLLAQNASVYYL